MWKWVVFLIDDVVLYFYDTWELLFLSVLKLDFMLIWYHSHLLALTFADCVFVDNWTLWEWFVAYVIMLLMVDWSVREEIIFMSAHIRALLFVWLYCRHGQQCFWLRRSVLFKTTKIFDISVSVRDLSEATGTKISFSGSALDRKRLHW